MTVSSPAELRKQYIDLARRWVRPGSGSSQLFLRERTVMQPVPDLRAIIRETPFVLVGGIATRRYMPERMTLDIDILILAGNETRLCEELEQAGCQRTGELTIGGTTWQLPDGSHLDVVVSDADWAKEALQYPETDQLGLPVIALPYLVIMKLLSGRVQDIADITRMLGGAGEVALQEVRAVVKRHLPEAAEDVESMIALGKLEYSSDAG